MIKKKPEQTFNSSVRNTDRYETLEDQLESWINSIVQSIIVVRFPLPSICGKIYQLNKSLSHGSRTLAFLT